MAIAQLPLPIGPLDGFANSRLRPPLKWAGGKRWQVPEIARLYEGHRQRRLVEPFCGGLAISLGLMPQEALLNDVNPHLINFYKWLKRGLKTRIPLINSVDYFYKYRTRFNKIIASEEPDTSEAAVLFYYLNRTGFNGLCRFNRSGLFNVPMGRYRTINYVTDFRHYSALFKNWEFSNVPFFELDLDRRDFVYADPPYDVEFTNYSRNGFSWEEQEKTAQWLARHKGPVVLVNQSTTRIRNLYEQLGYNLRFVKAPRRISCNGDRTAASEVIATRNL